MGIYSDIISALLHNQWKKKWQVIVWTCIGILRKISYANWNQEKNKNLGLSFNIKNVLSVRHLKLDEVPPLVQQLCSFSCWDLKTPISEYIVSDSCLLKLVFCPTDAGFLWLRSVQLQNLCIVCKHKYTITRYPQDIICTLYVAHLISKSFQ